MPTAQPGLIQLCISQMGVWGMGISLSLGIFSCDCNSSLSKPVCPRALAGPTGLPSTKLRAESFPRCPFPCPQGHLLHTAAHGTRDKMLPLLKV